MCECILVGQVVYIRSTVIEGLDNLIKSKQYLESGTVHTDYAVYKTTRLWDPELVPDVLGLGFHV